MSPLLRSHVKSAAETVLVRSGMTSVVARRLRGSALVLAYHNILPDGAEPGADTSLHLPHHAFARQLDLLVKHYDVVSLDELFGDVHRNRRPRAAITFDDAYRGAVCVGVAELARRNLPATIFVAPGLLEGQSFWWDALADAHGLPLDGEARERALWEWGGCDSEVRARAGSVGWGERTVPEWATSATAAQLDSAMQHAGLTLGSHSWSHPNLAAVSSAELDAELRRPLEWLQLRFSRVIPWIAYPYGLSSPAVEDAAARTGYVGALRVNGGHATARPHNPFAVPRMNVPAALTPNGFRLRLAGLFTH